ncbi:MAG TPA: four helix bundle protein [Bacteroidia bacterium]|nr:four helix bundle protein [Bacteroidia bacterium]
MATITRFEDLEIWRFARELYKRLIPLLEHAEEQKLFDLKAQIERSAGSVMDNIAEGFERDGNREFIQFLAISKASLGELRSQLFRAFDRKLINQEDLQLLQENCNTLAANIAGFMNYLNHSSFKGQKYKSKEQKS